MDNYAVIISVIGKIVSVVFPLVLGALLSVSSISQVAIYVLVLSAILFGVTFFVKAKRPAESGFSIKEYIGDLKARPKVAKKIKFIYIITIVYTILNSKTFVIQPKNKAQNKMTPTTG